MSTHFSANQYERAFSPQRLQNYQVPAKYKEHPSMRIGKTTIISNDRGHLNSSVRQSTASPWGPFVGTWQMERKPLNIKTKPRFYKTLEQSAPTSKQSYRASSARPASECSNQDSNKGSPVPDESKSPAPAGPEIHEMRPPSNADSRPATVGSVRSSEQGSRVSSAAISVRSPTPLQSSRASSVMESVAIATPSVKEVVSPSPKPPASAENGSVPQSPPQSAPQSGLHTSQHLDTSA